jgi:ParB family chromosome partitioning protein
MAENSAFKLKDMREMFRPTDPGAKAKSTPSWNLTLDNLIPFKAHPFKLYTGQRLDDMVESVRENGVIVPVIVRPVDDFNYEILSGHNRVTAAKAAGLETIPALVREGLSDEDALLVVTETNLRQRSFADMSHSERALALSLHHGAIKKQGRRSDLIQEIENMVNASHINDSEAFGAMRQKIDSRTQLGSQYDLSSRVVAYYLRVNKLTATLKDRLDGGELAIRAAVTLSYLSGGEQQIVADILDASHYKLNMKKAEALRLAANKRTLDHETVEQILAGTKKTKTACPAAFKLKPKLMSKYFTPEQKPTEIETIIIEALEFFYAHKDQEGEVIPYGGNGSENVSADDAAGETLLLESSVI